MGTAISDNLSYTPEGFLICKNVPVAHTGVMMYGLDEFDLSILEFPDSILREDGIPVVKDEERLFASETIASFEGKPVTVEHTFIEPQNARQNVVGHMFNVRRGLGELKEYLIADLMLTDDIAIKMVIDGTKREVSLGYDSTYKLGDDGLLHQDMMCGNHIALVDTGRAGKACCIYDGGGTL